MDAFDIFSFAAMTTVIHRFGFLEIQLRTSMTRKNEGNYLKKKRRKTANLFELPLEMGYLHWLGECIYVRKQAR